MRIRITRRPPKAYGTHHATLQVGRVYNLDSAVASAMIADGCAELDAALSADERRECEQRVQTEMWAASDREHAQQWMLLKFDPASNLSE